MRLYFLILITLLLSASCTTVNANKNQETPQEVESYNFDPVLKCGYFSYDDNFFVTVDKGCIYQSYQANNLGNILIYLIPKESDNALLDKMDAYEEYVNGLTVSELKKEFHLYVSIIPKEYLVQTPEGYYQKMEYVQDLYVYDGDLNNWRKVKSSKIATVEDERNNAKRIAEFIRKETNKSSNSVSTNASWKGTYVLTMNDLEHMGESHKLKLIFQISENDAVVSSQLDDENPQLSKAHFVDVSNESLSFTTEQKEEFTLSKNSQGEFTISGQGIYMINPPNDSYPIIKLN